MRTLYKLLAFILLLQSQQVLAWNHQIINYGPEDYNAGFQNWMIEQDNNGWVYIANDEGLLEFDGNRWNLYEIPNNTVRSLKIKSDTIFVGGSNEFGYFKAKTNGDFEYISLTPFTEYRKGEVWNIITILENVYFITDRSIHKYNSKTGKLITQNYNFKIDCSTKFQNAIITACFGAIHEIDGDNLKETILSKTNHLTTEKVNSLFSNNNQLYATTQKGVYKCDFNSITPFVKINNLINANYPIFTASAHNDIYAIGTINSGLCLYNLTETTKTRRYDAYSGLKNNTVLSTYFDLQGNLWLAMDRGISQIKLNSPIQPMYSMISPIGTGYCSAIYNNTLYLGTNQGLYRYIDDKAHLIKGSEGQVWSIKVIGEYLFATGDNGLVILDKYNKLQYIENIGVWSIIPSKKHENKFIASTYSGLAIIGQTKGKWSILNEIHELQDSPIGLIEDSTPNVFWFINSDKQIQRIKTDQDLQHIVERKTYQPDALVYNAKSINLIDNRLVICTDQGVLEYSHTSDSFHPSIQLNKMLDIEKEYQYLHLDDQKNIWYITHRDLNLLRYQNGKYNNEVIHIGMGNQIKSGYQNIQLIDSITAAVAIDNGFYKVDLKQLSKTMELAVPHIHSIVAEQDNKTIYFGSRQAKSNIELPYKKNTISILYGVQNTNNYKKNLYSYRLINNNRNWSRPTDEDKKDYTNLFEGDYTFEVVVVDEVGNHLSEITKVDFTILPPWYRSVWAFIIYFIAIVVFFYFLFDKILSKKKEELIAQKKEHDIVTELKDQRIIELQNENLKDKLKYKSQELSGQLLQTISKNEILEKVRNETHNLIKDIDKDTPKPKLKQNAYKLVAMINNNIDGDDNFEVFQSNFDIVHQGFFAKIDKTHPSLSRNDKVLCAYIHMNLLSKEIAPLMSISVRSVEVNRYRLRKKLGLEREDNLAEYLQNL